MQALRSHLNLITRPPDTAHGRKRMCTHSTEAFTCTHTRASTYSQKLNHIIAAQIINDIIFGCSVYTAGQLDARGNKEEGRERERERERGRNKESMYEKKEKGVDEKIWQTTERGKERVEMERWYRKREIVGVGEA